MREFVNFVKELFMLEKSDNSLVGLSRFKKPVVPVAEVVQPKKPKEVKISDLMRRA